jgi:hypothetical protein
MISDNVSNQQIKNSLLKMRASSQAQGKRGEALRASASVNATNSLVFKNQVKRPLSGYHRK